jgi:hypothetical protein
VSYHDTSINQSIGEKMGIKKLHLIFITTTMIMSSSCNYSGEETPDEAIDELVEAFSSGDEKSVRNLIISGKEEHEKIVNCPTKIGEKYKSNTEKAWDKAIENHLGQSMKVLGRDASKDKQGFRKIGEIMGPDGCKAIINHEGLNTRYQIEIDGKSHKFFVGFYKINRKYKINIFIMI